jgi:hypothetical protein
MDRVELAAAVIEPHFDAVRDVYAGFEPEPGKRLTTLKRTRFVVEPGVHDSERHYAMCRDDGLLIKVAPEAAQLDLETLTAVLAHEFGHAADFAYPGRWVPSRGKRAIWIGEGGCWHYDQHGNAEWRPQKGNDGRRVRKWQSLWHERDDDQVEWSADSIAYTVTGLKIQYCGPCLLQCFGAGAARPAGLR